MANSRISAGPALRLLSLAALLVFSAGLAFAEGPAAKPAATPSGIIVNHVFKVKTVGLDCAVCHSPSEKNARLMAFPTMDTCSPCHADAVDMGKGTDQCILCHSNADYSSKVRKDQVLMPGIKFEHARHADAKVECLSCHKIFDKTGVQGDEMLPAMNTCMSCHQAKKVKQGLDCATCHVDANIGSEKPASHTALWLQSHGKGLAKTAQSDCLLCHTPATGKDCSSCHQREAPKSHNAGWTLAAHSLAAKANPQSCNTCHTQSSCLDCHTQQKPWTHNSNWSLTGLKGGTLHCLGCHVSTGVTSIPTAMDGKCATCHTVPAATIQHQVALTPATHLSGLKSTATCVSCHATGILIPHPYSPTATRADCQSCH